MNCFAQFFLARPELKICNRWIPVIFFQGAEMPFLGAHMSIAGGHALAFARLAQVGGQALQIFVKNQRQWQAPALPAAEIEQFRRRWRECGEPPMAAHDSYLINLAASRPEIAERSVLALADELERTSLLGISYLIMHPGSHGGTGLEAGLARFTANLDRALALAPLAKQVTILIETTAGQGADLGSRFEEIAAMITASRYPERLGVCVDTCHIFAAGYDIRTPEVYAETFARFDQTIGLERLKFFHLNDARKDLGSRVDRHEHIGRGKIGLGGFRLLLNDPRFAGLPMVLETPKSKDLHEDAANLTILRGLRDM
jgi:deoxyribonuclease IV